MAAASKLAYHVIVVDENGESHTFSPDSESIPAWARKAITNPSAWADGGEGGTSDGEDAGSGENEPEAKPYAKWLKADLEAEVAKRNEARDADDQIEVGGTGTVKDLAAALDADDAAGDGA